ncbi:sodium:solute symporter [Parapedobacter sp. 10938]|uniref:sodium:solute symporter n=1 Tax=Parapedobacter flavus TaxID=3110225 RepID=UPI002DBD0B7B|nr:sodium:solute symporter [Parapedobacter sp. 10938]MEC3878989.1 sodium:solute symporter [Parapedobacter sp. 10938]
MTTSLTETDTVVTVLSNQSVSYRFYSDKPNLVFYQPPAGETDSLYVPDLGVVYTAEAAGAHHLLLNKGLANESYFHTITETRVPTDKFEPFKSGFSSLDIIIFVIYFVVQMGIGFWFYKKQKDRAQFFKGSGKVPMWAIGFSIFATALSAITFMAIPAKAYATDWSFSLINMGPILIAPLIAVLFIPKFRKLNVISGYQYIENRFNAVVSVFCSVSFILFHIGRIGIVLLLPSIALNVVTGIDIFLCISLMGVLSLLYTMAGGIEAVIWTDVIQVIVLMGGAILVVVLLVFTIPGGLAGIIQEANAHQKLSLGQINFDITQPTIWTLVLGAVFTNLITYGSDQTMIQRYVTASSEKEAKRSMWLNAWMVVPATILFFSIGTGLYVFYKTYPFKLNPGLQDGDSIFPWYIVTSLPSGVSGLLIAGIFAAAMSTLSSSMASSATSYCIDIHPRVFRNSKRNELVLARMVTFTLGAIGILFAYYMATLSVNSIWDEFNKVLGIILGSMGGVFLLGLLVRRANSFGAVVGIACSILAQLYVSLFTSMHFMLYSATGVISCFFVGWIASVVYQEIKHAKPGFK